MPSFPVVHLDLAFLDGFVAGDGCICLQVRNAGVDLRTSKVGYRDYVASRFVHMGLATSLRKDRILRHSSGYFREGGYAVYGMYVNAHPALTEQFHRWYPSGKKLFPPDFRISPDSLLQWYLGDGTLSYGKFPVLAVCPHQIPQFEDLLSQLRVLFGPIAAHSHTPVVKNLYFGSGANHRFFEYIGPCPVPAYAYRWPGAAYV